MNTRFQQARREAKLALLLTIGYLFAWLISAYLPDNQLGITGFPHWFESACLVLPLIFIVTTIGLIRYGFRDLSLEDSEDEDNE